MAVTERGEGGTRATAYDEGRRGVELRRLLDVWYRRRGLIVVVVILMIIGVEIANWYVYPTFDARTRLLIEAPVGLEVPFSRDQMVFKKSEITQTQSELALSRPNLEAVATALRLEERPRFTADLRGKTHQLVSNVTDYVRDTLQSTKQFVIERVFHGHYKAPVKPTRFDEVVADLQSSRVLSVEPVMNTDLIEVVVRDRDPNAAAAIANKVADEFLSREIALRKQRARTAYAAIQERLAILRPEFDQAWSALTKFKEQNTIASIDGQIDATLRTLSMLELTYWDVYQRESVRTLSAWQSQRQESTQERDMDLRTRTAIMDKMSELAELEATYQPDQAKVVAARAAVDELRKQIQEGLKGEGKDSNEPPGQDTEALKRALLAKLGSLHEDLGQLARLSAQYEALAWDRDQRGELLKFLARKGEDALTAEYTTQPQARVISPAQANFKPGWPAKWRNRGLAVLTGLILAIGWCGLLEYCDSSLRRPEDVARALGLRTLGSIPYVGR